MKNLAENKQEKSLLGQLRNLAVGEHLTVPASRMAYVRSCCVSFGMQWDREFRTSVNREARTITATRTR